MSLHLMFLSSKPKEVFVMFYIMQFIFENPNCPAVHLLNNITYFKLFLFQKSKAFG